MYRTEKPFRSLKLRYNLDPDRHSYRIDQLDPNRDSCVLFNNLERVGGELALRENNPPLTGVDSTPNNSTATALEGGGSTLFWTTRLFRTYWSAVNKEKFIVSDMFAIFDLICDQK